MIYLDNAATSGIKPEEVYKAVNDALRNCSGNPGRSGHALSLAAGRIVADARIKCSELFHAEDASCICFTNNTTTALNTAIFGMAKPGSHIITSALEHNSVSRPLSFLKKTGCSLTVLPASLDTGVDPDDLKKAITAATSLVVMTHISNVTGTVNDISAMGRICRESGIPFLVDAAQSAGTRKIDVQASCVDMLAFPGHKGLLGPQGTGGLYIRKELSLKPLTMGGTGSFSELSEQPEQLPDKFESGTLNVPGLAGLAAGINFLSEKGVDCIQAHETGLRKELLNGLNAIPGVKLFAPTAEFDGGCVISFRVGQLDPGDIAFILDGNFEIAVRSGLHCAPFAHEFLDTLKTGGTVRVSPGIFNSSEDIQRFLEAVEMISREMNI